MTIPGSGPIKLRDTIQGEFSGTEPTSISEYYRGGTYVPNSTLNINIPYIPAGSSAIKFSNFYNASGGFVYNKVFTTDTADYNFQTDLTNAGYPVGSTTAPPLYATITINPGVKIWSTFSGRVTIRVPGTAAIPNLQIFKIYNYGTILGGGGAGGRGGWIYSDGSSFVPYDGGNGAYGGGAITYQQSVPWSLYNYGIISGGAGGGGGGGLRNIFEIRFSNIYRTFLGGGGGGGGASFGQGGAGGTVSDPLLPYYFNYAPGNSGTTADLLNGGAGGPIININGYAGGNGGSQYAGVGATAGPSSAAGTQNLNSSFVTKGGTGGTSGYAILGWSFRASDSIQGTTYGAVI